MPDRFDLTFELAREDWLAVSEAFMRESPAWKEAKAQYSRSMRKQALWTAPVCIFGAAYTVGRGQSTQGMYLWGAGLGACFAALLYFALPRLDTVERRKRTELEKLRRADLSAFTGSVTISMDAQGIAIQSPNRELKLSWLAVVPAAVGEFVLLRHGGEDATIIPPRAFASGSAAAEFLGHAQRWWKAAQRPDAERLERYLADRDCACLRCGYNLRGMRGEACPECGETIRLEMLVRP